MNLLDVVLLVLLALAILGGLRVGFVARIASWLGLAAGVVLATWTVPYTLDLVEGGQPPLRFGAALIVLLVTVTVTTTLFQALGQRARRSIGASPLSRLDHAAGALAGALALVAMVWFVLPAASDVPGTIAREVRGSAVLSMVRTLGPPPPEASRALRALVDHSRFPEVLADLQRAQVEGPPPEAVALSPETVERATASTVNLSATGCGQRYEGSGFTVAADTIVTNAHVVAGADRVEVRRPDGEEFAGEVVVFDPDRDLAILRVPGLGQEPLVLAAMEPGDEGASIGYPGGQREPRVAPLRIDDRRGAIGRDIYGRERSERSVLFLAGDLQRGDSGSPLLDVDGQVGGVVFAISPDEPTVAYALDLEELDRVLASPPDPGYSGACIR